MKTEWRRIPGDTGSHVQELQADYGWSNLGTQEPYWSVTAVMRERPKRGGRWVDRCFGCQHDSVQATFPELTPTLRWHLAGKASGPMHYYENAVYWAEFIAGCSEFERRPCDPDPTEAFKRTVILLDSEAMPAIPTEWDPDTSQTAQREAVRKLVIAWCEERFERLMEAMRADLGPHAEAVVAR